MHAGQGRIQAFYLTYDFEVSSLIRQNIICADRLKDIVGRAWLIVWGFSLCHLVGFALQEDTACLSQPLKHLHTANQRRSIPLTSRLQHLLSQVQAF